MSAVKNVRISFAVAWFSNPIVSQGTIDVKEGEPYRTEGFEITADHRYLIAQSYDLDEKYSMRCEVSLKPGFFTQAMNFLKGNPYRTPPRNISISRSRRFRLSQVKNISFNNGYDDSCYSFREITADEFVSDNRTRRIFDEHQIISPEQLIRGKIIIYHHWHSGLEKTVPKKMVILEGETHDDTIAATLFKGLFLNEDGTTWEFWPFLGDCNVLPFKGYYSNKSYLIDTGETLSENEIILALSKNKNTYPALHEPYPTKEDRYA